MDVNPYELPHVASEPAQPVEWSNQATARLFWFGLIAMLTGGCVLLLGDAVLSA
jgi:hypothetical protein